MVRVISEPNSYTSVITLKRGFVFYCAGIVPDEIEHLVKMDCIASGEMRLIAKINLVVVVEGLWQLCTGANHILFIRPDRTHEGAGSLWLARPEQWPWLRDALVAANVPHVESVGGFHHVLLYRDELAIPESGSPLEFYGWIIKREDVERYVKQEREDRRSFGRLTIWHEVHWDHNGERFPVVRIEGWSEPRIKDDVTICEMNEFVVMFDEESRIVQRITVINVFVPNGVACDRAPLRSIAVGRKLPANLAIKK